MLEQNSSQVNIISVITETISTLISNLFSSVDNNLYNLLDDLLFINTDIINEDSFIKLLGNNSSGIILICNAILFAICLYYSFSLLLSHLTYVQVQKPTQFIFRLLLCTIALNFSFFICEKIIYLTSCISLAIRNVGEYIFDTEICFSSLIQELNSSISINGLSLNLFSFDGLIKTIISVGLISLIFSYSLRYIMLKVFVLISPFAIISLSIKNLSWVFKSWLKIFISLLFLQILVPLILLVGFSLNFSSDSTFSKLTIIGVIYALIKANSYMREFMGGISTDIGVNVSSMKNLFNAGG